MDSRKILIALAIHYQGDYRKIYNAIVNKNFVEEEVAETYLQAIKCNVLTILDKEYPRYLLESYCPPIVLFYYGDISLISDMNKNIAVVGSRHASQLGKENINYIVSGIAKQFNIVSGLAIGIDSVAHRAALNSEGRTIAVLANGIEYCYPSINEELYKTIKNKDLVISEYYGYLPPESHNFHQRNRLIVALSKGVIIGESTRRSGSSLTANLAIQSNKELLTIPSADIYNSLCNDLIRDGCPAILSPKDVIEHFDFVEKSLLCQVK